MVGLFQLLIFLCSLSKILLAEVKTLGKPFPWELRVRQECKEEAQIVCKECGWAQCVPTTDGKFMNFDPNYECCPNVRKEYKAYCCPLGYEFKCCAVLPQQKYALQPTFIWKTIWEFKEKCNSICICALTADALISGFCCDRSSDCGCCKTDPTISKLPAVARDPAKDASCTAEIVTKTSDPGNLVCMYIGRPAPNEPATACCDKGYGLWEVKWWDGTSSQFHKHRIRRGQKACEKQIADEYPFEERPAARCKWAEGWKSSICCPENYKLELGGSLSNEFVQNNFHSPDPSDDVETHVLDYPYSRYSRNPYVHNFMWYWSIHPIPELTSTYGPDWRKYTWNRINTAEMVRALDESSDCKQKEVYCACGALHFDQIMNGMCCDSDTSCACCSKWVRKPRQGKACNERILLEFMKEEKMEPFRAYCWLSSLYHPIRGTCCGLMYYFGIGDLKNDWLSWKVWKDTRLLSPACKDQMRNELGLEAPICLFSERSDNSGCCPNRYRLTDISNLQKAEDIIPRQGQKCKDEILHEFGIEEEAICELYKWAKNSECCDGNKRLVALKDAVLPHPDQYIPRQGQKCKDEILHELGIKEAKREAICLLSLGTKKTECCDENYRLVALKNVTSPQISTCEGHLRYEFGWKMPFCLLSEGSKKSECCDENYRLVALEDVNSSLPQVATNPWQGQACKDHILHELGQEQKKEAFCLWSEGWEDDESKCCDKNYQLVVMDQRYAEYKIRVAETPFAAIRGFDRHHPFCAARRPMIHLNVCAFEWYWVPKFE